MTAAAAVHSVPEEAQAAQFDAAELRLAMRDNPELWIHFHMAEHLTLPVPAFHVEVFTYLITFLFAQFALAVPRGHAKTTLIKLAIIWYFVYSPIRFIVYCSNTAPIAKNECADIINFLESENFVAVFGEIKWRKRNESDGLYIFEICTDPLNDIWKTCILRALGAGQQVRGLNIDNQRPELLVCDDAEDDENTETEMQRKKFKRWVYGPLFKACARHCKKVWIGNLVGAHCLIHEFCESEYWYSIKYGCILEDGTPLWGEMFDIEYLRKDFREYAAAGMAAKWFAEMMNMPVPDGMGLISAEQIDYKPAREPGDLQYGFITIDPAISQRTTADNTAIVVHGCIDDIWQVVEHIKEKLDPVTALNKAIDLCFKWRLSVIGIETVAFQAVLLDLLEFIKFERQCTNIQAVELHASTKKVERISGWASLLISKNYCLTEGEIEVTQQLLQFDPAKKENDDDLIDACAYGSQMITQHLNLIMMAYMQMKIVESKSLAQISAV